MEYIVSIKIDGRIDIAVDANSFEEARAEALASAKAGEFDPDDLDVVGVEAVNAVNEAGAFRDY